MAEHTTIVRFSNVSFHFNHTRPILHEASFSVRSGMKMALMGQNGAGKSTLFKLIMKELRPDSGDVSIDSSITVATARQVINPEDKMLTVEQFFHKTCPLPPHELRKRISAVANTVNVSAPLDKVLSSFSGGQQARLLLASALIQNPDLLLLDEPTNNLDYMGIYHLTDFLMNYKKSCIVISHDANFLNAFSNGVLYLDSYTHHIEQYAGDYADVVEEISARIEKENRQNARLAREIQENKEKVNFFAHKGGKMRKVAAKMREKIEEYESEKVDVRKEDKTIRSFTIPFQQNIPDMSITITSYTVMHNHQPVTQECAILMGKNHHLQVVGPNGIGKSTLIESLATGTAQGCTVSPGVSIGYYRQDFSTLNYEHTVYQSLQEALATSTSSCTEEQMRAIASGFLITKDLMLTRVSDISEGQKGLLSFARLVLQRPGLLILDEPTNHINFRHLPVIAAALDQYEGAMILVSHVPEFVAQIRIDQVLDLETGLTQ